MTATEKSLKQIADELGVDKQRVYRFVKKNHITASSEVMQTKLYDDAAQALINLEFSRITKQFERYGENQESGSFEAVKTHEEVLLATLMGELEIKNRQIESLTRQNEILTERFAALSESLAAAQALHAGSLKLQLSAAAAEPATPPAEEAATPAEDPRHRRKFFSRKKER